MDATLPVPNAELVSKACDEFDRENAVTEKALAELFAAYPGNDNPSHVLLKVAALNSLYATRILAVLKLATHIAGQGAAIDAALASGSPEAVDSVARLSIGEKDFTFYSFASKYCNWHQPSLYPVYDGRVDKYLWALKKQGIFQTEAFSNHEDLYSYPRFCLIVTAFREQFGLGSFTFKQIDKYLWSQGEAIWTIAEDMAPEEPAPEKAADFEEPSLLPQPELVNAFGEPADKSAAEVAVASESLQQETLPIYQPDAELLNRRDESAGLFLDRFPSAPEQPSGREPQ